jgi:tRNA modification GTPase
MYGTGDTIAAIATAPGESGVAVVRISGPVAREIAERVFRRTGGRGLSPGRLVYGRVVDPATGEPLDEAMACYLPGPRTYTREDTAELHCHGGLVAPRRVLAALLAAGARAAEPGEFTLRAFLNGRIDLAQAEAVLDVVQARTDAAMRLALGGVGGRLAARVRPIRQRALELLAQVSATIDFPDDDVPEAELRPALAALASELDTVLTDAGTGLLLRGGARVAIVGRPNVGKSSLLNALLGSERAIVTAMPGTTRDTVEEGVDLGGVPITLVDTAGMRAAGDEVERIGIERSRAAAEAAEALLVVLDRSAPLTAEDRAVLALAEGRRAVLVLNKADLPLGLAVDGLPPLPRAAVSALHRDGLAELERALREALGGATIAADAALPTNARHHNHLQAAACAVKDLLETYPMPDVIAAGLAAIVDELDSITGESASDELLATIFSRFCIGK